MGVDLPAAAVGLARSQHGVIRTADLRRYGVDRSRQHRLVAAGSLVSMYRGVLVVPGATDRWTRLATKQAACAQLVAERRTAAAIWRLDGFRDAPDSDLVWGSPPRGRYPVALARVARIPEGALTVHDGLRVTTPTWTLGDLPGASDDEVELAVEAALREGLTSVTKLRARGLPRGDQPPTGSYAETRFLQLVVRPLGLEDPERQVPIAAGAEAPYRCDFVFRRGGRMVDVEIDGLSVHGTPKARAHDLIRDERLRHQGCVVLRFAAERVERSPSSVGRTLLAELRALGPDDGGE